MNLKKKLRLNSITIKTLIYLSVFSSFILLLFLFLQMVFTSLVYERMQIKMMENIAQEIDETSYAKLDKKINDIVYKKAVCIEYVNQNGDSILYNGNSTGCLLGRNNSLLRKYKSDLIESEDDINALKFVNPDYKAKALLYAVKIRNGEYVFIFTMLSDINTSSIIIRSQLFYITMIVIIFAILMSLFLSRKLSKPILQITNKSKQVASGNYNVKFDKNGVLEIDELVDALNYLESEVSKTDEYRRDLMANVSHDLKTPLTMIKAYAEMIRDISYKDKKKTKENLEIIISEADRLNVLVNDILDLSKMQANADSLTIEEFDLKKEILTIIKKYEIIKETEDFHFEVDIPDNVIVKADKKKINQVIYNLVNNAINYTGDDKTVWIKVTENKKDYLVEIKDSGKGIDKDKIDYIWDRYYKHEKNHKRNIVGTGLGLSIVKSILQAHDFPYGVKSVKNKGTTFYFNIKK